MHVLGPQAVQMKCEDPPRAVHWRYHKYFEANVLALPRLPELWQELLSQKQTFKLALPETSKCKSPGQLFRYAEDMVSVVPWLLRTFLLKLSKHDLQIYMAFHFGSLLKQGTHRSLGGLQDRLHS